MRKILTLATITGIVLAGANLTISAIAQTPSNLFLAYPPQNHQTTASQIFLVGTAPVEGEVFINEKSIERSPAGHFAPSFPLQIGDNQFVLRHKNQEIQITVTRTSAALKISTTEDFAANSLTPASDIARLPGELICFGAVASPGASVTVRLGNQTVPLVLQSPIAQLPSNAAVLTASNQPTPVTVGQYQGCTAFSEPGSLGSPVFQLSLNGKTVSQPSSGTVAILSPTTLDVIEVTAEAGVTRTGPSTDYSRLTPLPKGTRTTVTGSEGEWLRLDYGAWIQAAETQSLPDKMPPRSLIRSVTSRQLAEGVTEIIFPLQFSVPISVQQQDRTFTLTLYNTTAQTDTIRLDDNPLIRRLDWQQLTPTQVQYTFHLKSEQQWGYALRYEGTSLILSLNHPPTGRTKSLASLQGIKILLDPGHGGEELGARGPNGYPEKEINLVVSKLLQQELQKRGAIVYMTRETDKEVSLQERVNRINQIKPAIALSIHYNALPDDGDAVKTAGIGTFWYHPQAHSLAVFLHNYLVNKLDRPSYGVFWNNLALTRPHAAPAVLLELGFMINPNEFEWITNPQQQQQLAAAIADGVTEWLSSMKT